jgi:selenocysteine-specific elongation factor
MRARGARVTDIAVIVVAADDGVMPQTREHLNIVGLLGITNGLVALSKIDLVTAERVAAVIGEIRALLDQTPLVSAPVVPVSSETGEGLDALRRELTRSLSAVRSKSEAWPFWMAVDRVFVVRGFGAVATGAIASGRVAKDAHLRLLPGGQTVRVRGIQMHHHPAETAVAGNRCALNLAGVDRQALRRGMVICEAELSRVTKTLDVRVTLAPELAKSLKSHTRVRFHSGAAEVMARLQWLEPTPPEPGGAGLAQLRLDEPMPLLYGHRYILRDETAQRTVGGGVVLDVFAERRGARLPERIERLRRLIVALAPPDLAEGLGSALEILAAGIFVGTETNFHITGPMHIHIRVPAKETV